MMIVGQAVLAGKSTAVGFAAFHQGERRCIVRIEHIECVHLRSEYQNGFRYAGGQCTARLTSLVLVHVESGEVGIGSAYSHPGIVDLVVRHQLAPMLIGLDATATVTVPPVFGVSCLLGVA